MNLHATAYLFMGDYYGRATKYARTRMDEVGITEETMKSMIDHGFLVIQKHGMLTYLYLGPAFDFKQVDKTFV